MSEPLLRSAGAVERDVFGTTDPDLIHATVDAFCRRHLGTSVDRYELFANSVGSVHGVRLGDGRGVVIKGHRAGVDPGHLAAVQRVQSWLADHEFPAPRPLLGPHRLGAGVAVVETLLEGGERADAHDPQVRAVVAGGLARLVSLCRPRAGLDGLVSARDGVARLWREPHDRRLDFVATRTGAEWIDRLAAAARRQLAAAGTVDDVVVGHYDWRVEHLRFTPSGEICAVFDWDSLATGPEPVAVGSAAHGFTADWDVEGLRCVPTLDESLAFIADYEAARGVPFTATEARTARAALVQMMAYSARCEHSDALTDQGERPPRPALEQVPAGGYRGFLARHGPELLGVEESGVPAVGPG